jgi:hypothetical protein
VGCSTHPRSGDLARQDAFAVCAMAGRVTDFGGVAYRSRPKSTLLFVDALRLAGSLAGSTEPEICQGSIRAAAGRDGERHRPEVSTVLGVSARR